MKNLSRRTFLQSAAATVCATTVQLNAAPRNVAGFKGKLCLFSKHLPGLAWQPLAQTVKKLGFAGIDLTARPNGHVTPERAAEDLPKAVAVIRAEGLEVPMITTGIISVKDPTARPLLTAAGKLGIPFYKPGYYKYEFKDTRRELEKAGDEFRQLVALSKECGIAVGYHNHTNYIGGSVWDMTRVIDALDPRWAGYYFDARHAVTEGGIGGWKSVLNFVAPRIKMIAIKDFYWDKGAKGWEPRDCPLGQGMVDWKYFFKALAQAGFQGPISLHVEYDIPGATPKAKEENMLLAVQRDFDYLKARVREAFGAD